ncbi:MAG: VOC family protein [Phycisphaerales bacterium]|nr:VOC family protein [Phycisphaerales bacterium]
MHPTHINPILNVASVPASIAWFESLGWRRTFTWNDAGMIPNAADANSHGPATFAGVGAGEVEIFLCLNAQGSRGRLPAHPADEQTGGVWLQVWLKTPADVDAAHALALTHRIAVNAPPADKPWGVRECHLTHPDGHTLRLAARHPH